MLVSLSSQNVIQYLHEAGLSSLEDGASADAELPGSSNLNILVTLADNRQLLVKQQRLFGDDAVATHELWNEWLFYKLLAAFPLLGNNSAFAFNGVHFDEKNSILVRNYLREYLELSSFYKEQDIFPTEISRTIGKALASLHRTTWNRKEYRDFMAIAPGGQFRYNYHNPAQGISSINPDIFGQIPTDALKFYILCQRYNSLESAIADLANNWRPSCLTHNDLQLDNILLHSRFSHLDDCLIRIIDWEACDWGDPLFDLGTILASYLLIWLNSLVIDSGLELEESLRMALIPLELIQPSLQNLVNSYLNAFPKILDYRPDFIPRVIQFAGLALLNQIQRRLYYHKLFDNTSICILQVSKNLLTMPQQSILNIFGMSEVEMIQPFKTLDFPSEENKDPKIIRLYSSKVRLRGC